MKPLLFALPGLCFFQIGEFKKAIFCTLLQLSIVGWIPAVIWALSSFNQEDFKKQKVLKILDDIRSCKVA